MYTSENLCNDTSPWMYFYFLINQYCCFRSENCDQLSWLWRSATSLQSQRQLKSGVFIIMCSFDLTLFKPTWKKEQIKTGNWYNTLSNISFNIEEMLGRMDIVPETQIMQLYCLILYWRCSGTHTGIVLSIF